MTEQLKVMTVRQPWAWAIIHGGKDVENRTRNLAGQYRGWVAIHAGIEFAEHWPLDGPLQDAFLAAKGRGENLTGKLRDVFDTGAIVGVARLVEVHGAPDDYDTTLCSPWAEDFRVHLVLAEAKPLTTPIPFRGALHLQTAPDDVKAEIVRQIGPLH